mmetsp:Transcript_5805/g.20512  ORF Transcript_5805/g.20512 Transcript_5805/m.20512 type:complete len:87 (-) Transcript_5805:27-287(-)
MNKHHSNQIRRSSSVTCTTLLYHMLETYTVEQAQSYQQNSIARLIQESSGQMQHEGNRQNMSRRGMQYEVTCSISVETNEGKGRGG